jgi:hypothetical protein
MAGGSEELSTHGVGGPDGGEPNEKAVTEEATVTNPIVHEPPTDSAATAPKSDIGSGFVGSIWIVLLSLALVALAGLVIVTLVQLWPASAGSSSTLLTNHVVLGIRANLNLDTNLILVAGLAGALGGLLHSLRSIARYVGERQLRWSWVLFYACLPFVAAILALLFYFLLRGGLISAQGTSKDISPYGIAAVSSLVGLFSDEAVEMLKKVFSNIFAKVPQGSDPVP